MEHTAIVDSSPWRRLMHRWFVQYNPLYLISAMLCLAGLHQLECGLGSRGPAFADLSVELITEAYALALIGGAALLTRLGQRRPGVMLAMLAAVYQGDVAMHTEACGYLGAIGIAAAVAWVGVFVLKLRALAWAVKIRPSRAAIALATYGAIGLAVIPHVVSRMSSAQQGGEFVALWVFSVGALGVHATPTVASVVDLDGWGRTVLRRSITAVWFLWATAIGVHCYVWSVTLSVNLTALVPVALLLGTRLLRSESRVWAVATATVIGVAIVAPTDFALGALMAAATLALRAWRCPRRVDADSLTNTAAPFRGIENDPTDRAPLQVWVLASTEPAARWRLTAGAIFATYLAAWTVHWTGGPWPAHFLALDLALTAVVIALVVRNRARIAIAPLLASYAHFAVQAQLVAMPRTALEWGAVLTAAAFTLLGVSLGVSYSLRPRPLAKEPSG